MRLVISTSAQFQLHFEQCTDELMKTLKAFKYHCEINFNVQWSLNPSFRFEKPLFYL